MAGWHDLILGNLYRNRYLKVIRVYRVSRSPENLPDGGQSLAAAQQRGLWRTHDACLTAH